MGNDPWWKITVEIWCWDMWEKIWQNQFREKQISCQGNGFQRGIGLRDSIPFKFQGIPIFSPNSWMFPQHTSRIFLKKGIKWPGGAWNSWNSCSFPAFPNPRGLGRMREVCWNLIPKIPGFVWDLPWINIPQINIPVYFLGIPGHGIFIPPGKGIEENPEIFGKKME